MIEFGRWYYNERQHEYIYFFCVKNDRIPYLKSDQLTGMTDIFINGRSVKVAQTGVDMGELVPSEKSDLFDRIVDIRKKRLIQDCFEDN